MNITYHAAQRMQQRAVKYSTIEYVLHYGKAYRNNSAIAYYLRKCDLPANDRNNPELAKLVGTTVIVSAIDNAIITVWKDPKNGLASISRKPKYNNYSREKKFINSKAIWGRF